MREKNSSRSRLRDTKWKQRRLRQQQINTNTNRVAACTRSADIVFFVRIHPFAARFSSHSPIHGRVHVSRSCCSLSLVPLTNTIALSHGQSVPKPDHPMRTHCSLQCCLKILSISIWRIAAATEHRLVITFAPLNRSERIRVIFSFLNSRKSIIVFRWWVSQPFSSCILREKSLPFDYFRFSVSFAVN